MELVRLSSPGLCAVSGSAHHRNLDSSVLEYLTILENAVGSSWVLFKWAWAAWSTMLNFINKAM